MGERRERVVKETCIKDPWTKPKQGADEKMETIILEQ